MSALDCIAVFIPAFRKPTRFQDDLLRRSSGVSLVKRAIEKARFVRDPERKSHRLNVSAHTKAEINSGAEILLSVYASLLNMETVLDANDIILSISRQDLEPTCTKGAAHLISVITCLAVVFLGGARGSEKLIESLFAVETGHVFS